MSSEPKKLDSDEGVFVSLAILESNIELLSWISLHEDNRACTDMKLGRGVFLLNKDMDPALHKNMSKLGHKKYWSEFVYGVVVGPLDKKDMEEAEKLPCKVINGCLVFIDLHDLSTRPELFIFAQEHRHALVRLYDALSRA